MPLPASDELDRRVSGGVRIEFIYKRRLSPEWVLLVYSCAARLLTS